MTRKLLRGPSRLYSSWLKGNLVIYGGQDGPGDEVFVAKTGLDTNDGLSWERAKLTIAAGAALMTGRGLSRLYVGPGAYSEAVSMPANSVAAHYEIIAYNPLDYSHGAVYWASGASSSPCLTILGRGCRVTGFEFECPTAAAGVQLDSTNGNAAYTQIDGCHFTGGKYGINAIGAPNYVNIIGNKFDLIQTSGGIAIGATAGANCNVWLIDGNIFVANINHIKFISASAPYSATIIRNVFHDTWVPGGSVTSAIELTTSGASNVITQNYLGGTYSIAGGYRGGTTDEWFGNYANVSGGVTQADPA